MADFDSLVDDSAQTQASAAMPQEGQTPSFDSLQDDSEKYSTPEQMGKTALEGIAQGVAGPLAPYLERKLDIAKGEDILGRQKENPVTHGAGEALGLGASTLAGVPGVGTGMEMAGEAAVHSLGLAEPVSYAAKVGSSAVKAAAEMAVLQGSDETAKMVLSDPDTSAQSAISNIGMAAALGGAGGAFMTGALSPLWRATVGDNVEKFLGGFKDHLNGVGHTIPEEMKAAQDTLGINIAPEIKGANVSPRGAQFYNDLKSSQSGAIKTAEATLHNDVANSIMQATGRTAEDFQNYDIASAGREGMNTFEKEYRAKSEPITKEFNDLTEPFKSAKVDDRHVAELSDAVVRKAQEKGWLGSDIPQQKIVNGVLNRLPELKTAEDVKRLMTTIDNIASENPMALSHAARDLKGLVLDTQQDVLGKAIQEGSPNLYDRYVNVRGQYKDLAKLSNEVGAQLNIGKFTGPEGLLAKLAEKRSPEEFMNKLSPAGNAEILPFLEKHFPQTLEHIKDNELKKLIAPAVKAAKGDLPLNVQTLNNAIKSKLAGQQAYAKWALPEALIKRAEAGEYLLKQAIPGIKDSGTAGWLQRKIAGLPSSAMGAVAWATGHNPLIGGLVGHAAELLNKQAPEAIKLALLRFVAADQPIEAQGFKSAVDFLHNVIKGEATINKATVNVFKPGTQVLADNLMPSKEDRTKLDKIIDKLQDKPDAMLAMTNGKTGHYFPDHQTQLSASAARNVQYLQSLKPRPHQAGPLDRPIAPSPAEEARYHRALDIANQPAIVLQHVKDGTVQVSDLQDLKALYPALYTKMAAKISNNMINRHSDEEPIPYKTRMGISLFLHQPVDSSMNPASIIAAQPKPKDPPPQAQAQGKAKRGVSSLGKTNKGYMTPNQAAESDRSGRD